LSRSCPLAVKSADSLLGFPYLNYLNSLFRYDGRMKRALLLSVFLMARTSSAQSVASIREGVTQALPLLQQSAGEFVAKRACFSCHHNALPIIMLHSARDRGFTVDSQVLNAVEDKTFRVLRGANALDDAVQALNLSDPTPNDSLLLMSARAAGLPADPTTAVYATRLMRWQRDGHWVTSDFRPPHSSSLFTSTATAIRAIRFYAPPELAAERDAAIARAQKWLSETQPESTEDASFRLLGLVWSAAGKPQITNATSSLLRLQQSNGGWPQLPGYDSDGYSTGEALFALHEAGVSPSAATWQRGAKFLLSTQARDGSWRVRTRMLSPAEVSPMYFPTGFPYIKDEFLSYAGSCWAVMALLSALPETEHTQFPSLAKEGLGVVRSTSEQISADVQRTAAFGSPSELGALLDSGLSPNSKTPNGTTLLMMAALDAEKVRLLIARGADVRARSENGTDALTVASSVRGTGASLQALLDAGAQPEAPAGVRTRRSPLVFAAMTGDLENIRSLLAHGAKPSAEALSEAVTFGYPDVVRTLISAGADPSGTGSGGINLLHWATIANRSEVIPILAAARVPVDAMDDFGLTPLMYAATLDHGNTKTAEALLKAGADRRIRNDERRTAFDEARRHKHVRLENVLTAEKR
jgi:ankyrin repeat protein